MRLRHMTIAVSLATLVGGCGAISGTTVEGPSDGSIVIRGTYSSVSNATQALEKDMRAEADKTCPQGWAKLDDTANRAALSGGRVWRIKCNSPGVAAGAAAGAGASAAAASAPPAAVAATPAPVSASGSVSVASPAAVTGKQALSREDVRQILTDAAIRVSPYLTQDAVRAIVDRQLDDLLSAQVQLVAPNGQPIPLAP